MTKASGLVAMFVVILLAIAGNTYINLHDHARLTGFVHAESVQRVTTIGERCEATRHQELEHGSQEQWFRESYGRCLKSLAKVEARAHVRYAP